MESNSRRIASPLDKSRCRRRTPGPRGVPEMLCSVPGAGAKLCCGSSAFKRASIAYPMRRRWFAASGWASGGNLVARVHQIRLPVVISVMPCRTWSRVFSSMKEVCCEATLTKHSHRGQRRDIRAAIAQPAARLERSSASNSRRDRECGRLFTPTSDGVRCALQSRRPSAQAVNMVISELGLSI